MAPVPPSMEAEGCDKLDFEFDSRYHKNRPCPQKPPSLSALCSQMHCLYSVSPLLLLPNSIEIPLCCISALLIQEISYHPLFESLLVVWLSVLIFGLTQLSILPARDYPYLQHFPDTACQNARITSLGPLELRSSELSPYPRCFTILTLL
jgi:hypothetical protein